MSVKLRAVSVARLAFGDQVAREVWFQQKLPVTQSMVNPAQQSLFTYKVRNVGND